MQPSLRNQEQTKDAADKFMVSHLRNLTFTDGRVVSWATETELTAAADWYNLEIRVTRDRQFTEWVTFSGEKIDGCTPNICMFLLLENNHFSLLTTGQAEQNNSGKQDISKNSSFDWFE